MIGAPLVVLGLLLTLGALFGARVARQERGAVATFLLSPLHPAGWDATWAIFVGFWLELFGFTVVVSLLSSGAPSAVFGIGLILIAFGVEGARVVARLERRRVTRADPRPLLAHPYRPYGTGLRDLLVALFLDVNRWRDVIYVIIAFPLAIIEFIVTLALRLASIALLSIPVWYLAGGIPGADPVALSGIPPVQLAGGLAMFAIVVVPTVAGLVMTMVAATAARGLMTLHRAVVAGLLCESEQQALERRVETLETSRRAVLAVEASELRRIERDLHDGAQQRLVMLAIDLSMAADRIDSDPAAARDLVVGARDQARLALAELRDLVRGIAPAILFDRGLVAALSAVASRSPIPTVVNSTLPPGERLADAVERAAYFVVTESLANVAKHASAGRCEIRCRHDGRDLVVEVWDDGAGGARIVPTGGLAGLAGRVEALDGSLTVESPEGGPTLIRATIPLAVSATATPGQASR